MDKYFGEVLPKHLTIQDVTDKTAGRGLLASNFATLNTQTKGDIYEIISL